MFKFYIQKLMPEAILKSNPECKPHIPTQGDVPYTYFQQIADIDLAKLWKRIDAPVLVVYGTSDPTTSAEESHYLVDMVNSFHSWAGTAAARARPIAAARCTS